MPDIPGRDVARMVKRASPRTKVVLCTGWGVQLDEAERRKLGVDDVVAKPFESEHILSISNRLLAR
jgi:CheY-like chemotaxis protein